ncbi:alpha-N-acetylgalactosaminide alpha-2,6-sialyltransferase 3 isoform X4 [Halichoerus grypus]
MLQAWKMVYCFASRKSVVCTSCMGIAREQVRSVGSQASPQTFQIRICNLSPPSQYFWSSPGLLNASASTTIQRKSMIAVSFIAAFLFLLVVRLVNEVNFPLLLNCFGQPGTKWIPFSYTYRRPLRTHYGYINVRTQEPLQLDCDLCAIVSNSGQMVGQKVGNEIDQSSCIWRMNNAPTKGYEEDVGRMTMIRVVSHTSVPLLLKNPDYFFKEANATIYVIWGPFRNMRKDGNGIVYNMLKKTVDIYPNAQIYVTTEKRMSYCDGVFKKETGKDSCWKVGCYLPEDKTTNFSSQVK